MNNRTMNKHRENINSKKSKNKLGQDRKRRRKKRKNENLQMTLFLFGKVKNALGKGKLADRMKAPHFNAI